jgi:DNA-directed RNA polymerase specialized sigma24 family protein
VGCPVGTVRSRIHRARAELRDKLRTLLKTDD